MQVRALSEIGGVSAYRVIDWAGSDTNRMSRRRASKAHAAPSNMIRRGPRASGPLIVLDCGAISPNLIESPLFGHARGAFTGADRDRLGAFEEAEKGTIFLDEIGELPLELQPKLLRVLESRSVTRVGESKRRAIDVRVVAATNRRLEREVNHGRFREDLYFRLSVVTLRIPPLRERLDDLEILVRALLDSLGAPEGMRLFDEPALSRLAEHDWPGNVRELRNFVERALVLDRVDRAAAIADSVPPSGTSADGNEGAGAVDLEVPLKTAKERLVADFESRYVRALLDWSGGNVKGRRRSLRCGPATTCCSAAAHRTSSTEVAP